MASPVRRIVTGHNAAGRSVILLDGPAPNHALKKVNRQFTAEDAGIKLRRLYLKRNG